MSRQVLRIVKNIIINAMSHYEGDNVTWRWRGEFLSVVCQVKWMEEYWVESSTPSLFTKVSLKEGIFLFIFFFSDIFIKSYLLKNHMSIMISLILHVSYRLEFEWLLYYQVSERPRLWWRQMYSLYLKIITDQLRSRMREALIKSINFTWDVILIFNALKRGYSWLSCEESFH